MSKFGTAWPILLTALVAAPAPADTPPTAPDGSTAAAPATPAPQQARIPFAKKNIWNWQVMDDKTVLIQDQSRKWYKATLLGNCNNLPFARRLGFDSGPTDTFDKFSVILVDGRRCPLISLVNTTAPKKSKTGKPAPAPSPQ